MKTVFQILYYYMPNFRQMAKTSNFDISMHKKLHRASWIFIYCTKQFREKCSWSSSHEHLQRYKYLTPKSPVRICFTAYRNWTYTYTVSPSLSHFDTTPVALLLHILVAILLGWIISSLCKTYENYTCSTKGLEQLMRISFSWYFSYPW